jgi:O-antigen ligase/tetratricopeptide (TPR) repeat protein
MNTSIETVLRRIILVSIFIVPFLVFLVPNSLFFPFITGKNFAFRIFVDVMFFVWAILAYYRAEYRPKYSWIMAAFSVFVVVIFIADVFGANSSRSFWSNYERMEGFVGLAHLFGYFVVAGSILSTEKLWMRYFHTITFTSIIMVFYGLFQLSGSIKINQSSTRLDGTLGNAAYLGVYMLFAFFFTALLLLRHKGSGAVKWVYGIIMFFQALILYHTATRGVIIGLAIGIVFSAVLMLLFSKKNRVIRNFSLGTLAVLVILVASLVVYRDSAFVKKSETLNRVASLSLTEALKNPRFQVWGMAMEGFKERPLLGWGQENFNLVFNKYYNPKMYTQEQWFDRAHNIFFDWLIAGGILGLIGYLSLFAAAFVFVWKDKDFMPREAGESWLARCKKTLKSYFAGERTAHVLEASLLSSLLIAYFVNNIFVFDNLFSYIFFFSLLAYLHHRHTEGGKNQKPVPSGAKGKNTLPEQLPFGPVAITVSLILVAVIYSVNMRPIFANKALINGIQPHSGNNTFTEENLQAFKDAVGYNTFGNGETREQILQAAMQVKDTAADNKLKQETFDFAKEQILLQMKDNPGDARYEMFAGMLFFRYGMNDEAITYFEQAHKDSPKKQTLDFNLILAYINAKQTDKAYTLAKEAYESEPAFSEAAKYYAITSLYKGDEQFADDLLTKTYGTNLYYDETLINVYAQLGRFDKVTQTLEKKLADGGDDPQTRLRLAAAYLEMGKTTESLAEIQKIINAHPDFKQQGEYYMTQIRAGKKP